jgi:hypothetical protein
VQFHSETNAVILCDMDGVIYHGNRLLDGAKEFVQWLHENDKLFPVPDQQQRTQPPGTAGEARSHGPLRHRRPLLHECSGHGLILGQPETQMEAPMSLVPPGS